MKANIITIGNEILIGQVIDTNSAFIARELNLVGISIHKIISIGDSREEIFKALNDTEDEVKIILMTGGLGPTSDDITKPALAEYFNSRIILSNEVLEDVKTFFQNRNLGLSERNKRQAEVPEICTVIRNTTGTAPGMWFEKNERIYISMPGVPFEMEDMLRSSVIPMLQKVLTLPSIINYTIVTSGIPESQMADKVSEWESELPSFIKLAYLPSPAILKLRISALVENAEIKNEVEIFTEKLKNLISEYIIGYDDDTIEKVIGEILKEKKCTVSTAESCTGGYISRMITSVAGASAYFRGGVVAYSNDIKNEVLGVENSAIIQYGAVSELVVKQMAEGIIKKFNSDYSIATSGIAGPDGATPDKPVGTTWIAVSSGKKTICKVFYFGDNRERNIIRASVTALNMLRMLILEKL